MKILLLVIAKDWDQWIKAIAQCGYHIIQFTYINIYCTYLWVDLKTQPICFQENNDKVFRMCDLL